MFDARLEGERAAIELTDSRHTDIAVLTARMEAVEVLGAVHAGVVAPIRIDGALVRPIGDCLMTAAPFIAGGRLDESVADDAGRLGSALAHLHGAMRQLDGSQIPTIAALASTAVDEDHRGWQVLHGDFGTQNVIATLDGLRILDFDDGGFGPVEYDLAKFALHDLVRSRDHEATRALRDLPAGVPRRLRERLGPTDLRRCRRPADRTPASKRSAAGSQTCRPPPSAFGRRRRSGSKHWPHS